MDEVHLTVKQAYPGDPSNGIARVDPRTLSELSVSPGDVIEIEGDSTTAALVRRLESGDWARDTIRLDSTLRDNAGVEVGSYVSIREASVREANRVKLAPAQEDISISPSVVTIIQKQLFDRPVMASDRLTIDTGSDQPFLRLAGSSATFVVVDTEPEGVLQITAETEFYVRETPVKPRERREGTAYADIGGLDAELERVRELIELPLKHPRLFEKLGIRPPSGVLLHGPPGTGKTLIAKAVADETQAEFHAISGPEIISKYYGESERELREVFDEASDPGTSVVFIDELDSIAPKRDEVNGEVERRVVAQLLDLMDGLDGRMDTVVIGATNRHDAVDPALRRPGRFDREIELGIPNESERTEILRIHVRDTPLGVGVSVDELASRTQGFVGADLESLTREAAMHALRRYLPDIDLDDEHLPPTLIERMIVGSADFENALDETEPSSMRDISGRVPDVSWDRIGGLARVKQELRESVLWPLEDPDRFDRLGVDAATGSLLYGPPGTGKTLLARVVASEANANFIPIKGPELLSKWVGESEAGVREVFQRARRVAPTVLFFDELDGLAATRSGGSVGTVSDRVVSQLLTELDGLQPIEHVAIMGATNRPDRLDPALRRTGRFDRLVEVGEPDFEDREQILKVHTEDTPLDSAVSLRELASWTEGYVGSDLETLAREGAIEAIREGRDMVSMQHFEAAIERIRPTMTEETRAYYDRVRDELDRNRRPVDGGQPRRFR